MSLGRKKREGTIKKGKKQTHTKLAFHHLIFHSHDGTDTHGMVVLHVLEGKEYLHERLNAFVVRAVGRGGRGGSEEGW